LLRLVGLADVAGEGLDVEPLGRERGPGLGEPLGLARRDRDACPRRGVGAGDGEPDAAASAGDEGGLSLEVDERPPGAFVRCVLHGTSAGGARGYTLGSPMRMFVALAIFEGVPR